MPTSAPGFSSVRGRATVVMLGGPSGIGKTALLRQSLETLRAQEPAPLILAGRCFEFESVPYKALDAVIDELARELRAASPDEVPSDAWALAALFPTLRRLPAPLHDRAAFGAALEGNT